MTPEADDPSPIFTGYSTFRRWVRAIEDSENSGKPKSETKDASKGGRPRTDESVSWLFNSGKRFAISSEADAEQLSPANCSVCGLRKQRTRLKRVFYRKGKVVKK